MGRRRYGLRSEAASPVRDSVTAARGNRHRRTTVWRASRTRNSGSMKCRPQGGCDSWYARNCCLKGSRKCPGISTCSISSAECSLPTAFHVWCKVSVATCCTRRTAIRREPASLRRRVIRVGDLQIWPPVSSCSGCSGRKAPKQRLDGFLWSWVRCSPLAGHPAISARCAQHMLENTVYEDGDSLTQSFHGKRVLQ
jgi:hypothetical protein